MNNSGPDSLSLIIWRVPRL